GGGPEPVVLRERISHAIWKGAEHHALEAEPGAVLQLLEAILHGCHRDDPQANQALRVLRARCPPHPVTVGRYGGEIGGLVGNITPQSWASLHVWEKHLRGAAVLVLLAPALLGRAYTRGLFDTYSKWLPVLSRATGTQVEIGHLQERCALN